MTIAKSELVDRRWYVGNSFYTKVAMWEASSNMFLFGYQWPGSQATFMRLNHQEDNSTELKFEPLETLNPQLPSSWTPDQCIQVSKRIEKGLS